MKDRELIEFATDFRKGILGDHSSKMMCFAVSAPLQGILSACGVNSELVETDLGECNHLFLVLDDGRVLDPTADQFNYWRKENLPPVYLGKKLDIHG